LFAFFVFLEKLKIWKNVDTLIFSSKNNFSQSLRKRVNRGNNSKNFNGKKGVIALKNFNIRNFNKFGFAILFQNDR